MKNLRLVIFALPILGGLLAGCGSGSAETVTKEQEQELRHPSHIPPAGYKPPSTAGAPPTPAGTPPTGG